MKRMLIDLAASDLYGFSFHFFFRELILSVKYKYFKSMKPWINHYYKTIESNHSSLRLRKFTEFIRFIR